jgi:radical SAM protein with 4Fe4S-binding SPASM domain
MQGFRRDCRLETKNNNVFIKIKEYSIPTPWNMAFLLSLMDGSRTQMQAVETVIAIGLASKNAFDRILDDFRVRYSVFLEEYPFGYKRNDLPSLSGLFKKNQEKIDIYNSYPLPIAMLYHVTSSCDKECKYCYLGKKSYQLENDILTKKDLFYIIDQLHDLGIGEILYTGGEPFLHPDLLEIINYASKQNIWNTVITKHYFSDEEAQFLGEMNMVKISLSYDCDIPSVADYLSGVVNHAMKMDLSIKRLLMNHVHLSIEPVVTRLNVNAMHDFLLHLHALGVSEVQFHRYINTGNDKSENLDLTKKQWRIVEELVKSKLLPCLHLYCEKYCNINDEEDASLYTGCVNGFASFNILPDGKVVFCDHMPDALKYCYGDLRSQKVEEMWNGSLRRELIHPSRDKFKNRPCGDCNNFDICLKKTACRKQSILENNNVLSPSSITYKLCAKYRAGIKSKNLSEVVEHE